MIPLILKLVPLQVQPEGKKKTVHVLQLVSPYTFNELLQLVDRSPQEIFMLPAPEEPPEDLYPDEVITDELDSLESGAPPADNPEISPMAEGLPAASQENPLKAWADVVQLYKELKPDEKRIQAWWKRAYNLDVELKDFSLARPPQKFGQQMIAVFRDKLKELKREQAAQELPLSWQ